ncbi:MAG: methyltransferase domain-containing protein [Candidatus Helarchaeota archaeon]
MNFDLDEINWGFPKYIDDSRSVFFKNRLLSRTLKRILQIKPTDWILDVGCGTGTVAQLIKGFLPRTAILKGIDTNPTLIQYANQKRWVQRRPNIQFELGNVYKIPYSNQLFNIVTSFGLFEYIKNIKRAFSEVIRVLNPLGRIVILNIDVLNYKTQPSNDAFAHFYPAYLKGMELAGVDFNLTRLKTLCKKMNLPLEEFPLRIEYSTEINQQYINLVETNIKNFFKDPTIIEQIIDFNYQFIKLVGWTREQVKEMVEYQQKTEYLLEFLNRNQGQIYHREFTIFIYRIQLEPSILGAFQEDSAFYNEAI